jgi:hypothetical protein
MNKLKLSASKEIWDETNPLPCVRIAFLSDFTDGNLLIDWEKWIDYCQTYYKEEWVQKPNTVIDYEGTLEGANKWILLNFINWL